MLVGAGALDATDEVLAVADTLGAGVAKALLGKAAVPDDVPYCTGSHRAAGHQAELGHDAGRRHAARWSASSLPVLGVPARRRAGQGGPDRPAPRGCCRIRYPMDLALVGDSQGRP